MFQPTASCIIKCKFGVLNFHSLVPSQRFEHRSPCLFIRLHMTERSKTPLTVTRLKYRLNKSSPFQVNQSVLLKRINKLDAIIYPHVQAVFSVLSVPCYSREGAIP